MLGVFCRGFLVLLFFVMVFASVEALLSGGELVESGGWYGLVGLFLGSVGFVVSVTLLANLDETCGRGAG